MENLKKVTSYSVNFSYSETLTIKSARAISRFRTIPRDYLSSVSGSVWYIISSIAYFPVIRTVCLIRSSRISASIGNSWTSARTMSHIPNCSRLFSG